MTKHFLILSLFLCSVVLQAQKITKLFQDEKFEELIQLENEEPQLSAEETYYLGYAFYRMENDKKAIQYYDKAIEKGFTDPVIYFQKGLSLMFDNQLDEASKYYDIAISKAQRPEFYLEKARIYKLQNKPEAEIETYLEGIKNTENDDRFYPELVKNAGNCYYAETKEYDKAANLYKTALEKIPADYQIYEKLIKAFNAEKKYEAADAYFMKAKELYDKKAFTNDEILKMKNLAVDEFEWNGQWLNVFKSFEKPKDMLDVLYTVYLIDKNGEKIERKFNIEKSLQMTKKDPEFLVCEELRNGHSTYAVGFKDDSFTLDQLQNLIKSLLDKSVKPAASIQKNN